MSFEESVVNTLKKMDSFLVYYIFSAASIASISSMMFLIGFISITTLATIVASVVTFGISVIVVALCFCLLTLVYMEISYYARPHIYGLSLHNFLLIEHNVIYRINNRRVMFMIGLKPVWTLYKRMFNRFECKQLNYSELLDYTFRLDPHRVEIYASKITGFVYVTYVTDIMGWYYNITFKTTPYNISSLLNTLDDIEEEIAKTKKVVEKVNWKKEGF